MKSYQNKRNKAVVLNYRQICTFLTSLVTQTVKRLPTIWDTQAQSLGREDPLEEGMTAHPSVLAWKLPMDRGAWWAAVRGVAKSRTRLSDFTFIFHFHASEKEMATHSNVLAWRIPGTGEPGGLPSVGSHRVGHEDTTEAT